MTNSPSRIWEIDLFRGIAILLMVSFHLIFDLNTFWGYNFSYRDGFWYYTGKLSAILFMTIAGISSDLSIRCFRRGLVVFCWGILITLSTYLYNPQTYIRFGILHLLGSCMMLFPLAKNLNPIWLIVAGTAAGISGQWTAQLDIQTALLLPFGATPAGFASLDYYPLLPWSGFFLYGAAIEKMLYKKHRPLFSQPQWLRPLTCLGRYSLPIYLIHQPVLLSLLSLLHYINYG